MPGGASESFAAWQRGSVPAPAEDGILTAEEIGGLNLSRTWLTVASAWKSGDGDARPRRGILGLGRST